MQDQYFTYTMFDVQAWYARDVILQKIKLPSKEEREKDIKKWFDRGSSLNDCYEDIAFQRDYIKDVEQVIAEKINLLNEPKSVYTRVD